MIHLKVGGLYVHNCGCVSMGAQRTEGPGSYHSIILRLKKQCSRYDAHPGTTAYYREDVGTYNGYETVPNFGLHVKREIEP